MIVKVEIKKKGSKNVLKVQEIIILIDTISAELHIFQAFYILVFI